MTKIGMSLLKYFTRSLYLQGVINEEQVSDPELVYGKILESYAEAGGFLFVTDHRDDLLKHATYFSDIGNKSLSIVMYAMYFEHAINSVVVIALKRIGINTKMKNEILKSASLDAKLSWVLELIGLPKFNDGHRKFILSLASERNALVHYKFNAVNLDEMTDTSSDKMLVDVKRSVRYMKSYSSRVEYNGKKQAIDRRLSKF